MNDTTSDTESIRDVAWRACQATYWLYAIGVTIAASGAAILFGFGGFLLTAGLGMAAAMLIVLALAHHYEINL